MIIDARPIFLRDAKCDNLAWLKSNNFVIPRIFLLHTRSYTFLKFPYLTGKRHLIFENLGINETVPDGLKIYEKLALLKFKIFLE